MKLSIHPYLYCTLRQTVEHWGLNVSGLFRDYSAHCSIYRTISHSYSWVRLRWSWGMLSGQYNPETADWWYQALSSFGGAGGVTFCYSMSSNQDGPRTLSPDAICRWLVCHRLQRLPMNFSRFFWIPQFPFPSKCTLFLDLQQQP